MKLIARIIRFTRYEPWWLLLTPAALASFFAYRTWSLHSLFTLFACSALAFLFSYTFRNFGVLNYGRVKRPVKAVPYVTLACVVAMQTFGHEQVFKAVLVAYLSLSVGLIFWASSDPMFEMAQWLAFPTEYGRLPDDIELFDSRMIDWPGLDFTIQAYLFRFLYDGQWEFGITGPITFSLGDQNFNGKAADEIYAAYASWYDSEGIGQMIDDEIDSQSAV